MTVYIIDAGLFSGKENFIITIELSYFQYSGFSFIFMCEASRFQIKWLE